MKIAGWLLFSLGVVLLLAAMIGYAGGETGAAGPQLITGLGLAAVPLVIGLLLLSRPEQNKRPSAHPHE